jgi:zinc D-Ala-D-Ala carboxypeptidase
MDQAMQTIASPEVQDAQLSPHFPLSEMLLSQQATRLGIANIPGVEALANLRRVCAVLELVREALGNRPITVSSGYRSPAVNKAVGGDKFSAHLLGLAADFICPGFGTPLQICRRIVAAHIPFDQLIYEGTWVHLGLSSLGTPPRGEVLTAVFARGRKPTYLKGLPA